MSLPNPFDHLAGGEILETLLPDFLAGFVFFTALSYMVLGKRFGHHRAAVAMSASIGLALSVGLVWWEIDKGVSIRNLGPIAAGFAIIILASVMYPAIKQVGGTWAGAAIAFGASILVGWALGLDWPLDARVVQTLATVTLIVGVLAFLGHRRAEFKHFALTEPDHGSVRHDIGDLRKGRQVAQRLTRNLHDVRQRADALDQHPDLAEGLMQHLRRILPEEGWLTQRLAEVRKKAHLMREGHVGKIREIQDVIRNAPAPTKRKIQHELSARYRELQIDVRVERLDKAVVDTERRVRELTSQAIQYLEQHHYQALPAVLEAAEKLQKHNVKLIHLIEKTEEKLSKIMEQVARESDEVKNA